MVAGHFAVGFALKKVEPRLSLGFLILGANLVDILLGFFLFLGVEHARPFSSLTTAYPIDFYYYPFTHSLAGVIGWSLIGYAAYRLWPTGNRASRKRPALVFAAAIFSHFVLDVPSHLPDLTLWGDTAHKFGFALYNNMPLTFFVETTLLYLGVSLYRNVTVSTSPAGKYGLALMVFFIMCGFIVSLIDAFLRFLVPSLPEMTGLILFLIAGHSIFVAWGFWVDARRTIAQKNY